MAPVSRPKTPPDDWDEDVVSVNMCCTLWCWTASLSDWASPRNAARRLRLSSFSCCCCSLSLSLLPPAPVSVPVPVPVPPAPAAAAASASTRAVYSHRAVDCKWDSAISLHISCSCSSNTHALTLRQQSQSLATISAISIFFDSSREEELLLIADFAASRELWAAVCVEPMNAICSSRFDWITSAATDQ